MCCRLQKLESVSCARHTVRVLAVPLALVADPILSSRSAINQECDLRRVPRSEDVQIADGSAGLALVQISAGHSATCGFLENPH